MQRVITPESNKKELLIDDCIDLDEVVYAGYKGNEKYIKDKQHFIISKSGRYEWCLIDPKGITKYWSSNEVGACSCNTFGLKDIIKILIKDYNAEVFKFNNLIEYVKWYEFCGKEY